MRISIVGTGYVGLVSGACLADKGHHVICVDIDSHKVDMINRGEPPIYEEGLPELLQANVGKTLFATTDLHEAVMDSEISLIAVGTPFDGSAIDLKFIKMVSRELGEILKDKDDYHVIVVKSTVVPGTTEDVVLPIIEAASGKKAGVDFGLGMNPEFLREGQAIPDFMFPDRIVMGGIDQRSLDAQQKMYAVYEGVDKVATTPKTAEMIKYTANALLATLISFSNEIGNLCAALGGIDVVDVMRGVHLDKRLTPILPSGERVVPAITTYLEAGCGFGGSCFPKDVKALVAHGQRNGRSMQLLNSVIQVNKDQPKEVISMLNKHFSSLNGVDVAVLGLAFKPGTDDMRESPAIPVVNYLLEQGAHIKAYDQVARHEAYKIFGNGQIHYCDDLEDTLDNVDAVVLMTKWDEFDQVPALLSKKAEQPIFVDGRRMIDKNSVTHYEGIGLTNA